MAYELQTRRPWWYGNQRPRDEHCGPVEQGSLMQLVPECITQDPSVGCFWKDDFLRPPAVANGWTLVEDAGGTAPIMLDIKNGWWRQFTDGEDEDEFYLHTTNEMFLLEAGKHLWWEARVTLTEVSGVTANYIFGLSENVGAAHLQDAGAGPTATYDGMCWFKVDSDMFFNFETSLAGAQVTSVDYVPHVSGTTYRFGAWCVPSSPTTFLVYPWYSIGNARGVLGTAQVQNLALGGGEMQAFFGCKTGDVGGATEESIDIDYFWVAQQR